MSDVTCWGSLRVEVYEVPRKSEPGARLVKFFPELRGGIWECDKRCPAPAGTCYHIRWAQECRANGCMPMTIEKGGADVMGQEMAVRKVSTVAVIGVDYTPEQWVMLRRLVKLRQGQAVPHQEELALMVQEAAHLDLDPLAGECYFINFGDGWVCYPHWQGLVKIAEGTGEYQGHDGPFYSEDGEHWTEAWVKDTAPKVCKVVVYRANHRPTTAVVKYARASKGSGPWTKDPEAQLGKAALRLALRRAFPREADKPLSPAQLKALHTLASLEGLGGAEMRDERLDIVSEMIGRPVGSFKELSVAEASTVFETWSDKEEDLPAGDWAEDTQREGVVPAEQTAAPAPGEGVVASTIPASRGELTTPPERPVDLWQGAEPLTTERLVPASREELVKALRALYTKDMTEDRKVLQAGGDPAMTWRPLWAQAAMEIRQPDGWAAFPTAMTVDELLQMQVWRESATK